MPRSELLSLPRFAPELFLVRQRFCHNRIRTLTYWLFWSPFLDREKSRPNLFFYQAFGFGQTIFTVPACVTVATKASGCLLSVFAIRGKASTNIAAISSPFKPFAVRTKARTP